MTGWRSLYRSGITFIIPVGVVGVAVIIAIRNRESFYELTSMPTHLILLIAVLTTSAFFINSTEFFILYKSLGLNITNQRHWLIHSIGQLGNYLPGQIGTLYRVRYLKKNHGLDMLKSAAVYGTNLLLLLTAAGFLCISSFLVKFMESSEVSFFILGVGATFILVSLMLLKLDSKAFLPFGALSKYTSKFDSGRRQILEHKATSVLVLLLEIIRLSLGSLRMMLLFSFIGMESSLGLALWLSPLGALTTFIALTPGGLGLRELVIGAGAGLEGSSFGEALTVASGERAINLTLVIIFGIFAFFRLSLGTRAQSQIDSVASHSDDE